MERNGHVFAISLLAVPQPRRRLVSMRPAVLRPPRGGLRTSPRTSRVVLALTPDFAPTPPSTAIVVGAVVPVAVFLYGLAEFTKRVIIQRRCAVCAGSGLVPAASNGRLVKCRECGGFFPWTSAARFFEATTRPGNGGPLLVPRGQSGRLSYRVPSVEEAAEARRRVARRGESGDDEESE